MCVNVREKQRECVWVRGSVCERERFAATDLLFWITKLIFFQVVLRCRYARDFCLRNLIQPRCLPSSSSIYPRSKVTKGFWDYVIFSNLQSRLHTRASTKLFLPCRHKNSRNMTFTRIQEYLKKNMLMKSNSMAAFIFFLCVERVDAKKLKCDNSWIRWCLGSNDDKPNRLKSFRLWQEKNIIHLLVAKFHKLF